jgi:trk system potassium uptake protein TrkH
MRERFQRIHCILNLTGSLLLVLSALLLIPLAFVSLNWHSGAEDWRTLLAFAVPAAGSLLLGFLLMRLFKPKPLDMTGSMLLCAISWLVASGIGAVPFVIGLGQNYLNSYFEAMSGFTTTGITVLSGLDAMPQSILFWRSLTQWLGGIGILSFFLIVTYGSGAHHLFGAESHKISSGRPRPGLFSTLKILWLIYTLFTVLAATAYALEEMPIFDAICHALTTLSTGGYSPHDASIEFYRQAGHPHYKMIEYTVTFFMMLGGINFLVHYRVLTGDIRALWDNIEVRYWWRLILAFTGIIIIDHMHKSGALAQLFTKGGEMTLSDFEEIFRTTIFQVIGILTTTGFGTKDIGGDFFGAISKQLFLIMMVIGGCVGSTGGGFKVLRVAILNRLMMRELFKIRTSPRAVSPLTIDNKPVPDDEAHRVSALFFTWIAFLLVGGAVTALFSRHGPWESLSGMFSALGNIGPCYISVQQMIEISPVVKITYIIGMLAGRLEILPVLLLFSQRSWR